VARITIEPHREIRRSARGEIRAEAERTAWFCAPESRAVEVFGV
jgi:hypothetical protein